MSGQGGKNVVSQPLDTQFRNRAGELQIDMDTLNTISNQWFIEIKMYIALKPPSDDIVHAIHFYNKVNFAILDQAGTLLMSSMQSRVCQLPYPNDVHTRVFTQTFFHTVDITKM